MIVVFGSINFDLIFSLPSLPAVGETVVGPSYRQAAGGKGANQADAARRDGASVRLFGCVGDDSFAAAALTQLRADGVDLSGLRARASPTGCAAVLVDGEGRNQIAVASGANAEADAAMVPDAVLGPATTLVLQMEVPQAANAALMARARQAGARIVLNLAPARAIDAATLALADVIVVNETEAATLGHALGLDGEARGLARRLGTTVVLTLGGEGAVAATADAAWRCEALRVKPIDTVGAGDAFVGVLAAALDRGARLEDALRRASVAGSLACLKPGAQPSLPLAAEIDARLAELTPARRV